MLLSQYSRVVVYSADLLDEGDAILYGGYCGHRATLGHILPTLPKDRTLGILFCLQIFIHLNANQYTSSFGRS